MLVRLDPKKSPMLFIGNHHWTMANPVVDGLKFSELSEADQKALKTNIERGVLIADEKLPERDATERKTASKDEVIEVMSGTELIKFTRKEELEIRELLKSPISKIPSKLKKKDISELRKILFIEKDMKNRKKMVAVIEDFIAKAQRKIAREVAKKMEGVTFSETKAEENGTNVTPVVESEKEQIEIAIPKESK